MPDYVIQRCNGEEPIVIPNPDANSFRIALHNAIVAGLVAAGEFPDARAARNWMYTLSDERYSEPGWEPRVGVGAERRPITFRFDLCSAVLLPWRHALDDVNFLLCDLRGADVRDCDLAYSHMTTAQASTLGWANRRTRLPHTGTAYVCPHCEAILDHGGDGVSCPEGWCESCCEDEGHITCAQCGTHGVLSLDERGGCPSCVDVERRERGRFRSVRETYDVLRGAGEKPTRAVGFEWEVNDAVNAAPVRSYVEAHRHGIHSDGSCGWEVVTRPLGSDEALERTVAGLAQAFQQGGVRADERCSVHVHVDARDLRWSHIALLCHVQARFEPLLFALCGQKRCENSYCRPFARRWGSAGTRVKSERLRVLLAVLAADDNGNVYGDETAAVQRRYARGVDKKESGRYCALNLMPWLAGKKTRRADTTVEYRMHCATLSGARVLGWVRLVRDIVDWCVTHSAREFAALPSNDLKALFKVSPRSRMWILRRLRAWHGATKRSGRTVTRRGDGRWVYTRDGFCVTEIPTLKAPRGAAVREEIDPEDTGADAVDPEGERTLDYESRLSGAACGGAAASGGGGDVCEF